MSEIPITPYDEEIAGIVRARQRAYRETNAFQTSTPLDNEDRQRVIADLPPLGEPDAIRHRLSSMVAFDMNSLDLDRCDNNGDWAQGAEIDAEIEVFFNELYANSAMQAELGVHALTGYIKKGVHLARPESHAVSLGPELDYLGIFHAIRMRNVARLAIVSSGDIMTVRKRSDFRFGGQPETPQELTAKAKLIASGGWPADFIFRERLDIDKLGAVFATIRAQFNVGIEAAIQERAPWLSPINMNYYVKVDDQH